MARYYGGIQGNRGTATRLGTASSGLTAFANGWHIGAQVNLYPASRDSDEDELTITLNHGSSRNPRDFHLGTFDKLDITILSNSDIKNFLYNYLEDVKLQNRTDNPPTISEWVLRRAL
ncbi:MAG TPA: hypothetical protein PKV77_11050 [Bacteroidales bacterium]|jgi:hypothetical protein|nr:hypothetical protein [Bacteroidales bacterium]HPV27690.1 hypothetical protein [Bacteroidales bacterium]